jgi:transcriptional regulator with XRE-family HTH domain
MADTLGSLLRQKRESLGLTLEKVEGLTHIRVKHLQAIESDDLSSIPSVPQARGFIRNYASFLGLSPEDISTRVGKTRPRREKLPAETVPPAPPAAIPAPPSQPLNPVSGSVPQTPPGVPAGSTRSRASITAPVVARSSAYAKTRPAPAPSLGRRWFRLDLLLGVAVTLVIIALLGWGGYHIAISMKGSATLASAEPFLPLSSDAAATASQPVYITDTGTGPFTGSQLASSGTGEPSRETAGQTPEETVSRPGITPGTVSVDTPLPTTLPTPLGGVYTDVRIHIIVVQRAYLEVEVDGKIEPPLGGSGRVQPGETYDFVGQKFVKISTGNGAGIRVIFNGVDEGTMGRFGEVVTQTYTPTGIITPIPSRTPTPTVTLTPTVTKKP